MGVNSNQRIAHLRATAQTALQTHQIDVSQPDASTTTTLAPVVATIMEEAGCTRRTAHKYARHAVEAARGTPITSALRGGKRGGGRPRGEPKQRPAVYLSDEVMAAIERYRNAQHPRPSFTAAIEALLRSHPALQ